MGSFLVEEWFWMVGWFWMVFDGHFLTFPSIVCWSVWMGGWENPM